MGNGAFRERGFEPEEVRRILRQATQLADRDPGAVARRPLSRGELVRLGGELGLPPAAIEGAIDGVVSQPTRNADDPKTTVAFEETLDGEVPPEAHEDLADELKKVMAVDGTLEVVGRSLTWKANPRLGGLVTVTVRSRSGGTSVRVEEDLKGQRSAMLVLFWASFFPLAFGGSLAAGKALGSVTMAILLAVLALTTAIFMPSRAFAATERRRRKDLELKMARLCDLVRDRVRAAPAPTRIAVPAHAAEAGSDAEADEAEADDEASSRARR